MTQSHIGVLSGILMAALPIVLLLVVRRRRQLYWGWLGSGALMFVAMQLPKALTGIVLAIQQWTPGWSLAVVGALLPGVWEEVGKWLPFRIRRPLNWDAVLSFGLGFGAVEALIIGLQTAVLSIIAAVNPQQLPADLLAQFTAPVTAVSLLGPLFAVVERSAAVALHTAWSFLNAKAVLLRRVSLLLLAMLLHTGIDIFAGYYQFINNAAWVVVALEAALVIAGLIGIRYVTRSMAEPFPGTNE